MIPCHYDTFPPIETDAQAFKADVESAGGRAGRGARARGESHAMTMTHAVVLIEAERDALSTLGGALADIEGVAEAYSVTGEWDFVAIVRVPDHEQLADVVTGQIGQAARASRARRRWSPSQAYSRHDLEALFSVGRSSPRRDASPRSCGRRLRWDRLRRGCPRCPKSEYGPTLGRAAGAPLAGAPRGAVRARCGWRRPRCSRRRSRARRLPWRAPRSPTGGRCRSASATGGSTARGPTRGGTCGCSA